MKNKIKRFAKGDFHIPQPEIIFPETHIVMRVGEGEKYRGSFSLKNQGEGTIRGLVYPSSYRVQCDEQGFDSSTTSYRQPVFSFQKRVDAGACRTWEVYDRLQRRRV